MFRARAMVLLLALSGVTLAVPAAVADSGCDVQEHSWAHNDPQHSTGWCEGYYFADCTFCWNTAGGGATCSTGGPYCTPHIRNPVG